MDTGVALGVVGTATGVASFVWGTHKWRVERSDRQHEIATERDAREEAADLERARFQAEMEDRLRARHADITAEQLESREADNGFRIYPFRLRNFGPSYSKHVRAWLEKRDGTPASERSLGRALNVGEETEVELPVPRSVWEPEVPVRLVVGWFPERGEGGEQTEPSNLLVRHD